MVFHFNEVLQPQYLIFVLSAILNLCTEGETLVAFAQGIIFAGKCHRMAYVFISVGICF